MSVLKGTAVLQDLKQYLDSGEVNQATVYRWMASWGQGKTINAQVGKQAALTEFMRVMQQRADEMNESLKKIDGNVDDIKKTAQETKQSVEEVKKGQVLILQKLDDAVARSSADPAVVQKVVDPQMKEEAGMEEEAGAEEVEESEAEESEEEENEGEESEVVVSDREEEPEEVVSEEESVSDSQSEANFEAELQTEIEQASMKRREQRAEVSEQYRDAVDELEIEKEDALELLRTYKQRRESLLVDRDEEMADIADSRGALMESISRKRKERAEDKALTAAGVPWYRRSRRCT